MVKMAKGEKKKKNNPFSTILAEQYRNNINTTDVYRDCSPSAQVAPPKAVPAQRSDPTRTAPHRGTDPTAPHGTPGRARSDPQRCRGRAERTLRFPLRTEPRTAPARCHAERWERDAAGSGAAPYSPRSILDPRLSAPFPPCAARCSARLHGGGGRALNLAPRGAPRPPPRPAAASAGEGPAQGRDSRGIGWEGAQEPRRGAPLPAAPPPLPQS